MEERESPKYSEAPLRAWPLRPWPSLGPLYPGPKSCLVLLLLGPGEHRHTSTHRRGSCLPVPPVISETSMHPQRALREPGCDRMVGRPHGTGPTGGPMVALSQ